MGDSGWSDIEFPEEWRPVNDAAEVVLWHDTGVEWLMPVQKFYGQLDRMTRSKWVAEIKGSGVLPSTIWVPRPLLVAHSFVTRHYLGDRRLRRSGRPWKFGKRTLREVLAADPTLCEAIISVRLMLASGMLDRRQAAESVQSLLEGEGESSDVEN